MKNNRCFKLTALLFLAMIMVFSTFSALAEEGNDGADAQIGPVGALVLYARDLRDGPFVKKDDIIMDGKTKVTLDKNADPNHSFVLKLEVSEPVGAADAEEMLPEDTDLVTMSYPLPYVTIEDGKNEVVSWSYQGNALIFKWVNGKKTSFSAEIPLVPNYPADQDISGSYVLGTASKVMLSIGGFTEGNRHRLNASTFTEEDGAIRPNTDVDAIWVLNHVSGNYYTIKSRNTGEYLYINQNAQTGKYAKSLYLVDGDEKTAQKILVKDQGQGYYSLHYNDHSAVITNAGEHAVNGFAVYSDKGAGSKDNEKFKLYPESALLHNATIDVSGSWAITNLKGKNILTSETLQDGRLKAIKYDDTTGALIPSTQFSMFTFTHVNRNWYTVSTEGGYLHIEKDDKNNLLKVFISSTPQNLMVRTYANWNDGSILLTNSEYDNARYAALSNIGNNEENGYGAAQPTNNDQTRTYLRRDVVTSETYLAFNMIGGKGANVPFPVQGKAGDTVTLPNSDANLNGMQFIGWYTTKNFYKKDSDEKTTYHRLLRAGDTYTLKEGPQTLYAVYDSTKHDVRFGVRVDGAIQDEPNNYDTGSYKGHFWMYNLRVANTWVIDINGNKNVNGYYLDNDVTAALSTVPTADQIKTALKAEGNIPFDPETQYIHWYVLKYTGSEWHIDGVIRNRDLASVTYHTNVDEASRIDIGNMPSGYQTEEGAEVSAGTGKDGKFHEPTREGFEFAGWNTEPDGSGITYSSEEAITVDGSVNLYAMWIDPNGRKVTISMDWPSDKIAYPGAVITLTAHLEGFSENVELQWQHSTDQNNWIDVEGANEITHTFTLDAETATYYWRVVADE